MKKHFLILALIWLCSCKKETPAPSVTSQNYSAEPVLPEKPYEYPFSENTHLTALGRVLFYDKNLSHNNSVSCGSCHQQLSAFCDNQKSSPGLNGVMSARNTPGIFNKRTRAFWDGRAEDFTHQALM